MKNKDVVKSETWQKIEHFARLGREIKITPKSNIEINEAGYSKKYFVPSISVLIGIGNDHTATLLMDVESWEALKNGAKIDITTTQDIKKKYG